jgi:ubiquinone/menaquinone biosynthesis C-methylase UbiE
VRRGKVARWAIAGAGIAAAAWWWSDSAPYPYTQRWILDWPVPFLTNRRLDALLGAQPGERVLEIGPGTGLQALHVAGQLGETGRLDIVDIQQAMLDHVMRRAAASRSRIAPIIPALADATKLPFPEASFDAAYLVTVLGEIPDPAAAISELGRVLRPGGRLIVGECFDPHFVPLVTLLRYANAAGLTLGARLGPPPVYLAQLRR